MIYNIYHYNIIIYIKYIYKNLTGPKWSFSSGRGSGMFGGGHGPAPVCFSCRQCPLAEPSCLLHFHCLFPK